MKVLIIEFLWQVDRIINQNIVKKYDLIISLDPESSYHLQKNSIKFLETDQILEHEKILRNYEKLSLNSLQICSLIDQELYEIDDNFKRLNWEIFNDFHYIIKIAYDQLIYFSEVFSKLFEKYDVKDITVCESSPLFFEDKLISSKISILETLLKTLNLKRKNITLSKMSVKKVKNKKIKLNIKSYLRDLINSFKFYFDLSTKNLKYLSIRSFEVDYFNKTYPNFEKKIINYKCNNSFIKKYENINKLLVNLSKNEKLTKLFKNKDFDFSKIFEKLIIEISNHFSYVIKEYKKNKKFFEKKNFNAFIFSSSSPNYLPTIFFRKIAKDLNISQVIWAHGGFAGTKSLVGNDILDFRLCKNHIFYGDHFSNYMKNFKYGLHRYEKFTWNKNFNFYTVGSPKMDFQFESSKKKVEDLNKKKTIVFLTGAITKRNHYYFGNLRDDNKYSFWRLNLKILNVLKKYQEKYNIIIKDYFNGQHRLWKKMLHDTQSYNIRYVYNNKTVAEIISGSDLIVLPWFSTTFFESLYSSADIFLLEKEIIDELKDK